MDTEDRISSIAGSFGPWQAGVFLLAALVKVPSAWHMLGVLFKAPSVDFWCVQPKKLAYLPTEVWINLSHPIVKINQEVKFHNPCEIYDVGYEDILRDQNYNEMGITDFAKNLSYSTPRRTCQQFQYDNSLFQETVVTEWNLVCNRKILVSVSQFFYLFGILNGGLAATLLIPRLGLKTNITSIGPNKTQSAIDTIKDALLTVGPRWILLFGAATQIITGTATAFVPLLEITIALRFSAACGCAFMFTAGYMICRDITWGKSRILVCAFYEWFWSFGVMSLPGLCLLFGTKTWRSLQIAISVPTTVLLMIAFFYLPESPRWLLQNGRSEEAEKIVRRMAIVNGRTIPNDQPLNLYVEPKSVQGYLTEAKKDKSSVRCLSWLELLQDPKTGKMIALHLLWAITIVTYYGALLNVKNLGNNLFLNTFIAGIAEMVGVTFGALICLYKKRQKWTWLGSIMIIGGLSSSASCFLLFDMDPESLKPISYIWWHQWVLVMLGMAGRVAIACSLTLLQLSSTEVIQSDLLPVTSISTITFARVCLSSAPFIGNLAIYGECVSLTAFGSLTILGGIASTFLSPSKTHPVINLKSKVIRRLHGKQGLWTMEQNIQRKTELEHEDYFNQNFIPD